MYSKLLKMASNHPTNAQTSRHNFSVTHYRHFVDAHSLLSHKFVLPRWLAGIERMVVPRYLADIWDGLGRYLEG